MATIIIAFSMGVIVASVVLIALNEWFQRQEKFMTMSEGRRREMYQEEQNKNLTPPGGGH